MRQYFIALPVLAALLFGGNQPAQAADDAAIGTILSIDGTATVQLADAKDTIPAKAQMHIHMHDVIKTGPKSRLFLEFVDNTQMTLAESTKLTVDEYVFDPDNKADNKARYNVMEGTFDYLSGLVTKKKDPDVKIQTAYGAIGIRGTSLWGGNVPGHGYGIHVAEGQIGVSNGGGSVNFGAGLGTFIPGPGQPPGPPGPWTQDELNFINALIFGGKQGLLDGNKGNQKGLLAEYLKWLHHHHHHGDNGPDTDGKDLPQDETGAPDLVPFSPQSPNNND